MDPLAWNSVTALAALAASMPLLSWVWGMCRGERSKTEAQLRALLTICFSTGISAWVWWQVKEGASFHTTDHWIDIGNAASGLTLSWGIHVDFLAAAMLTLVSSIATLVHVYSIAYLDKDPGYSRYFSHLGFFCAAMMWLVLADNLLLMFISWELMGLASYLLIGFWREMEGPARASQKAFLFNRIGDVGFMIGIMILLTGTGTLDLLLLTKKSGELTPSWQVAAGLCLFLGAAGKSAQFPLQSWLPAAMEGPTPVSSLLHAATMVAAGVYLLARISFLLLPVAGTIIAFVGAFTALIAAISAMRQWDIKRVLAYSTVSQLGYMVMGIGVGARDMALLHLFTHAFFKCGLFLVAGAVIHAMHTQDLRHMGGLKARHPLLFWLYVPPMLALSGLPLFSGFLSKDGILLGASQWAAQGGGLHWLVPTAGFVTAGLTAFYMGRHAWLIFFEQPATEGTNHTYTVSAHMVWPILILAIGSCWFPFSLHPLDGHQSWLLHGWAVHDPEHMTYHLPVLLLSLIMTLAGFATAYALRHALRGDGSEVPKVFENINAFFQRHEYLGEWFYERIMAESLFKLGKLADRIDRRVIDGGVHAFAWLAVHPGKSPSLSSMAAAIDDHLIDGMVNGLARWTVGAGRRLRQLNTGEVQGSLWLVLLLVIFTLIVIWWT